jgi:uncharacterized protein (DUF486 family)
MSDYLSFIPQLFANPTTNAIALTTIPAVLYTGAAYGFLLVKNASLLVSILISVFFATLEYIVRVPVIKYSHEIAGMSNGLIQLVWVIITLLFGWLSGWLVPAPVVAQVVKPV